MYIIIKNYIFLFFCFINYFKNLIVDILLINNFIQIEIYLKKCNNFEFKNINKFNKIDKPKISIISPIHNSSRFLLRFINRIQYQNFKDIEIILVDDFSIDNSTKIIENFQINDGRIKLMKNKRNKGTFISRNLGILISKGKYLLIPDPDDILSKNILTNCYKYAERYKYDLIRFNMYMGNRQLHLKEIVDKLEKILIYLYFMEIMNLK